MTRQHFCGFAPIVVMTLAAAGCATSGGGGASGGTFGAGVVANAPINHGAARSLTLAHISAAINHADASMQFMDGASMLGDVLGRAGDQSDDVEVDLSKLNDEVVDFIKERVMVPGQVESDQGEMVTYRMTPALFCQSTSANNDCVKFLGDMAVRLRVVSPTKDALAVSLLFDDVQVELARAELSDGLVRVTVLLDVEQAGQAACKANPLSCLGKVFEEMVGTVVNKSTADLVGAKELAGRVVVEYRKTAAATMRMSVRVQKPVVIAYSHKSDTYRGSLGISDVTVEVDSGAESVQAAVKLGAVSASAPYHFVAEEFTHCAVEDNEGWCEEYKKPTKGGQLLATVAGLSLATKVIRKQDKLTVDGLSLGGAPAQLQHNGATIASVDLQTGATGWSLSLSSKQKKRFEVAAAQPLKVTATVAPNAYKSDLDLPSWLVDETVTASTVGAPSWVIHDDDAVQLLSGPLSLTSDKGDVKQLSAAAGQCLVEAKGQAGKVGLLRFWKAVQCEL